MSGKEGENRIMCEGDGLVEDKEIDKVMQMEFV